MTHPAPGPAPDGRRRVLAAAVAGTVSCALPVFLVGALAVQIRDSLHFGAGTLGTLIAVYYTGAAVSSALLGRLVEYAGALRTMRAASVVSAAMLAAVAVTARSVIPMGAFMLVAGVSSAAMQPASNTYLARRMQRHRQGVAFGIKQSAVPLTASLAGLAVPALALTVGWRWAFALGAGLAATVAVVLPRSSVSWAARRAAASGGDAPARSGSGPLWVLAGGFGLGLLAAGSLTAFLASSAVAAGAGRSSAGLLVGLGGAAAVVGRVLAGWHADRRSRDHLPVVAAMLAVGAAGYLALAAISATHATYAYVPVVVMVFGFGWGWNGLFNYAVVHAHRDHPGWATGVTQTGGRLGGVIGPFLFGQLVSRASYAVAWSAAAGACLMAAAVLMAGRRLASGRGTEPVTASGGPA